MRYLDAFRDPKAAKAFRTRIHNHAATLAPTRQRVAIMEVCGSHTMAIARYAIREVLPPGIDLISGPGCPVCVTPPGYIDAAIELARRDALLVTFGDMLNVPGSDASLAECRAEGAAVEVSYSPSSALELAAENPDREIVFLAVGFETTMAPVVSLVPSAITRNLKNLSLLTAFKLVPPALSALLADPEVAVDAFLCPAHVSAIIGSNAYEPYAQQGTPCIVAGFEPLDILMGLDGILEQLLAGQARVDNQYSRVVRPDGNRKAQELIAHYLEPVDAPWRGIGTLPLSGMALRSQFSGFDAAVRFDIALGPGKEAPGCLCGDVIKGKCRPSSCALFGTACTPEAPVGPCMVSSEGSCAAAYKYER
jgi:hydrogenase expression/formation protein HypD